MILNSTFDGASTFKIKRPLITSSGFTSDVDPTIKSHFDELNTLLGKRILANPAQYELQAEEKKEGKTARTSADRSRLVPDLQQILSKPLAPKRIPENNWAENSLASQFSQAKEVIDNLTLSEYIDMTADLSALKYEFQGNISDNWFNLDYNTKAVLDSYPAIQDYLVAYGFFIMDLQEVNGLKNFILSNRLGAKNVANYAIVSAARTIIDQEQLKVPFYDVDSSEIVADIKAAGLSTSTASFKTTLQARIDDFVFNNNESQLIDGAGIGVLPAGIKPQLIKYIKNSPVPITALNVKFFLPLFINQIAGTTPAADPTVVDTEESDKDFDVQFLEDDNSLIKVSKSAVRCASQLYYSMVLGDELNVFHAMNHFTHKYLIRGAIEIQDSTLRDDLQQYVFSNKFTTKDPRTNVDVLKDRTRPAERQMFANLVFGGGKAQMGDDFIPNQEFPKLWKVLILESAKYLERAQAAYNPDSYVSRQNVMQAVEDLQYNLSTHCTGLANVITPLIYEELNFIIKRIFMHPEVLRQVVPAGGTWWRVVEVLFMDMRKPRPKATVLYNKAKLGHDIIRSVAEYDPASFEDDKSFSAFISSVDAFITTQSILQEALSDDLKKQDDDSDGRQNSYRKPAMEAAPMPAQTAPPAAGKDEWDF